MLEYAAQAVLTTVLLASGKWFVGLLHLGVLCFFIKMYMMRQHTVDTTDVFKQLPQHKQRRMALFVFFIVTFVLVTYRWGGVGGPGPCGQRCTDERHGGSGEWVAACPWPWLHSDEWRTGLPLHVLCCTELRSP